MTHLPIELAHARATAKTAWKIHDMLIDEGTPAQLADAAIKASECDNISHQWYQRWQALGGTSDIASIVETDQAAEPEGSDTSWKSQLADAGFGDGGVM